MATMHDNNETVVWPKRAVVTAGMPYGNKGLHFGHVGGVFVPADCFARFLRDRIGAENVRFISGTDCFGSPINEGYRKLVEAGQFDGTIEDYVLRNHNRQKDTLDSYDISLDIYEGSNIGHSGEVHQLISEAFIKKLYENGWLQKRATLQFYDPEAGTFLNGRQVQGHCPVQGCKSEHAYADECDLGHSYAPEDLIAPKSSLTGVMPEMRPVENWYFDLPAFNAFLKKHVEALEADPEVRPIVPQTIKEFLAPPVVYIKNELYDQYLQIADKLAHHQYHEAEKGKQSFEIEFDTIDDRDAARDVLAAAGIRLPQLHVVMRLGTTEGIKSFVRNSDTMAIVSVISVVDCLRSGVLRIVDWEDLTMRRDFSFVHAETTPAPLAGQFIDFARANL